MERKLPPGAFEFYVGLGPSRSYQRVADEFGVSKRTVTKHAVRGKWQERVEELEAKASERATARMVESLEEMNLRHTKALKAVQGKAIEALRTFSLASAMEAVRALDMAIRHERTIRGEPADRTAISVEEMVRTQHERWVASSDQRQLDFPVDDN